MWWLISVSAVLGAGTGWCARRTATLFVGERVVVRRGWCEAICVVGVAATAWIEMGEPEPWRLLCAIVFWWWCVSLGVIDLYTRRLPNALTVPGFLVIVGIGAATGGATAAIVGGILLAAAYLVLYLGVPGSLGAGDVKLALGVGAAAGLAGGGAWLCAAVLAPALTGAAGCVVLAARRSPPALPHGPAMCAATLVALLAAHIT
ncbi:prepilin peptidase [Rhodococcus marinonascens]|uniref:prepilin peptidase n=1 Tax=Rhodococcus marinonascens TaxID=38311 RepID=UPI000932BE7B|nr:A24 family peptidase [Rhodococcus marinonascens]